MATASTIYPHTRVEKIAGIGPKLAETLMLNGIATALDLLFYLPRTWEDLSQLHTIAEALPSSDKYTLRATLGKITSFRSSKKRMLITQATFTDATGAIEAIWFNQPYLTSQLKTDEEYYLTGIVKAGARKASLISPTYESATHLPIHSGRIIPTYASMGGLTTKVLRRIFLKLLPQLEPIAEILPQNLLDAHQLASLDTALRALHLPSSMEDIEVGKQRLAFDELLATQLQIQIAKNQLHQKTATPIPVDLDFVREVIGKLPYTLTNGQKKALWDILQDIEKSTPTNRLVEGDVGSGKTIVAALAMMSAAHAHHQAVLMAPTEVLAHQHYTNLQPLFTAFAIETSLLTASKTIGTSDAPIVIGTHKLISQKVALPNANLVIVDEQHRFGVRQREALRKGKTATENLAHFVSLTATPIPRSLALTLFGDLDLSIIPSPPSNRQPVTTKVVSPENRQIVYEHIERAIRAGHQAFVVVPIITDSLKLAAKSTATAAQELAAALPNVRIGILHGKLSSESKEEIMQHFTAGQIDVLIATTVIEVGIDVSNATVMFIEGADRFGLAQLHQLRGRVGRSHHASYCFVTPTSAEPDILERLELFAQTTNGFKLAELDLELRGPGTLLGTAQAGFVKFRLADWSNPVKIEQAQLAAKTLLAASPDLSAYPKLLERFRLHTPEFHNE